MTPSKIAFGSVTWKPGDTLSREEAQDALAFAAKFGVRAEKRIARLEFGMAGTKCIGIRTLPGARGEPDPLNDEPDPDVPMDTCDDCDARFPESDDALNCCRVCDNMICDECQDVHERNCDRWEL